MKNYIGGVAGKPKAGDTIHKQCCVFSRAQKLPVNLVGPDGSQQQFDTQSSLISAHQWPHRPCSGPSLFYRVRKRPPVKADLGYSWYVWTVGECSYNVKQ